MFYTGVLHTQDRKHSTKHGTVCEENRRFDQVVRGVLAKLPNGCQYLELDGVDILCPQHTMCILQNFVHPKYLQKSEAVEFY